jgi:hypothetical protein
MDSQLGQQTIASSSPQRFAHLWRRHGGLIIGLLWIVALTLGCIGFALNAPSAGKSARFFDVAYRTLQLIPMNSGDASGNVGWQLDAARFLIPFLAAWTAIRGLLALFRDRWHQFLLRFWRDHAIICGLSRKDWLPAQGFAARGDRVAVIEADESHDLIGPCRERGIVVRRGGAKRQVGESEGARKVTSGMQVRILGSQPFGRRHRQQAVVG